MGGDFSHGSMSGGNFGHGSMGGDDFGHGSMGGDDFGHGSMGGDDFGHGGDDKPESDDFGGKAPKGPEPCDAECQACKPKCEKRCSGDDEEDCYACVEENKAVCEECAACHESHHDFGDKAPKGPEQCDAECQACKPKCEKQCSGDDDDACFECVNA